jgi:transposase
MNMSINFWLSDAQMAPLEPYFPKSHGKPGADDWRFLSGIIFINRSGLMWRDAFTAYGSAQVKGIVAPVGPRKRRKRSTALGSAGARKGSSLG